MEYFELTKKIIKCAYAVYNKLGYGFLESVYEKSILIELKNAGLRAEAQKPIRVFYKGESVGDFIADIIVEDVVIIELKSVSKIIKAHEVQLVNYLVATGKPIGLLINFGEKGIEVKRKVKELKNKISRPIWDNKDMINHEDPVNPVKKIARINADIDG